MAQRQHVRRGPAGIKTLFRALLPALATLACGAAPSVSKPAPTIVVFGDSLTAGYGLPGGAPRAWPALLDAKLKADGVSCEIVNAGLSGETSAGGLRRVDWILKRHTDIFVLELGGNDGLRGVPPAAMERNLDGILAKVRAKYPEAKLVVAGMRMPANTGDYAKAFDAVFAAVAKKHGATLVPFLLDGVADKPELMQDDGIHPNPNGHAAIAAKVAPVIAPLVAPETSHKNSPEVQKNPSRNSAPVPMSPSP